VTMPIWPWREKGLDSIAKSPGCGSAFARAYSLSPGNSSVRASPASQSSLFPRKLLLGCKRTNAVISPGDGPTMRAMALVGIRRRSRRWRAGETPPGSRGFQRCCGTSEWEQEPARAEEYPSNITNFGSCSSDFSIRFPQDGYAPCLYDQSPDTPAESPL